MADLGRLTDGELEAVLIGLTKSTFGREIGMERAARVAIGAAVRLAAEVEGEAGAWTMLRDALAVATARARCAAHPRPEIVA